VLYLAEKYNRFIPTNPAHKVEMMNWIFWQMGGQGPMCGNFGHFFVYAPPDKLETRDYGCARYGMEVQRLCDVLEKHLTDKTYLINNEYSIADIMCFPWARQLKTGYIHSDGNSARNFLSVDEKYPNMMAWIARIDERPAVQRGLTVCSFTSSDTKPWLASKVPTSQEESK
jgi:GST-like protein